MKDPNGFDGIARRKLQERAFAFDEAQWTSVERSLQASRERRRRSFRLLALAALFIGVVGTWWNGLGTKEPVVTANVEIAPARTSTGITAPAPPENEPGASSASPVHTDEPSSIGVDKEAAVVVERPIEQAAPVERRKSSVHATTQPKPRAAVVPQEVHEKGNAVQVHAAEADEQDERPMTTGTSEPVPVPTAPVVAPGVGVVKNEPGIVVSGTEVVNEVVPITTSETPTATEQSASTPQPTSGTPATTPLPALEPVVSSMDSAMSTPPVPPASAIPSGRCELSLLGGGFSTLNHYAWNTGTDAAVEVERASSLGYGTELMKMGAHFGVGGGLHVSTYAERINAAELSSTEQTHYTHWFLATVDTTMMIIVDTVMDGGTIHYVTDQMDTTFTFLDSEVLTNTLVHQQREARELMNRVSYLEIPLLFDAHLRSGHWNFGLRGGPTVAFLTASRGALPNAAQDGYVDLQREQLNAMVFGYSARLYLRYALNEAWALGLEPTVKGQLTSTLTTSGPERRSSAVGAFFSVTYRLP